MIRTYAQIVGVILLAVAAAGFVIFRWEAISIFYHAGVGLLFLYVGFSRLEATTVRQMVGGLGVLLVVVKTVTILTPLMWGGPPQHGPVEFTCLALGISSILAARYLKDGRSS